MKYTLKEILERGDVEVPNVTVSKKNLEEILWEAVDCVINGGSPMAIDIARTDPDDNVIRLSWSYNGIHYYETALVIGATDRNVYEEVEYWMDCFHTTDHDQTIYAAMKIISIMGELLHGCGAQERYFSDKCLNDMHLSALSPDVPENERIKDLNELILFYLRIKNRLEDEV